MQRKLFCRYTVWCSPTVVQSFCAWWTPQASSQACARGSANLFQVSFNAAQLSITPPDNLTALKECDIHHCCPCPCLTTRQQPACPGVSCCVVSYSPLGALLHTPTATMLRCATNIIKMVKPCRSAALVMFLHACAAVRQGVMFAKYEMQAASQLSF